MKLQPIRPHPARLNPKLLEAQCNYTLKQISFQPTFKQFKLQIQEQMNFGPLPIPIPPQRPKLQLPKFHFRPPNFSKLQFNPQLFQNTFPIPNLFKITFWFPKLSLIALWPLNFHQMILNQNFWKLHFDPQNFHNITKCP